MEKAESKQEVVERVPEGPLQTEHGDTSIEDRVVEKIAEIAAREVPGVYAMGTSTQRTFSNIAGKISRSATAGPSGVSVKKGVVQASIDLTIVVEYGFSIVEVADGIRANIIDRVSQMTGLDVVEVNIDVSDVHLPSEDDEESNDDAAAQLR
ncbi:Asp23/Gls24 family envelope stress response protein [Galactobacter caseinivorans]|uniref:Asp23/Gls24 family envelope stress response protein n=2 Tax=Galactobacter caseinivorans TaxID=2676123 RepID=A0A496PHV2_9MICC|nr:Asp23/Gls24 family envelope stress response protein [Galactobacter caseinivorans]